MARPKKDNADYFSHDCGMRNDKKLKAMRKNFGHEGYAFYNMMLEVLTNEDGLHYELTDINIELLAGDFDSVTETVRNMIEYSVKIELFKIDDQNFIYTDGLNKRLKVVFDKRNRAKERFLNQKHENNEVSVTETTQSKVKESKVKESKVDTINTTPNGVVNSDELTQSKNGENLNKGKRKTTDKRLAVENQNALLSKAYGSLVESLNGQKREDCWTAIKNFIEQNKPCFLNPYVDAWNIFAINYGIIKNPIHITENRRAKIIIRTREATFDFLKILEKIKSSKFLKGDKLEWKVDFDFIIESEQNYIKILEEKYK